MISIQTKRLFPLIISAIACLSHNSATGIDNSGNFTINGRIANMPDSCSIHLMRSNGQLGDTMTEVPVINGSFQFTAETDGNPETLYIISLSPGFPNYRAAIWVAPGETIEITGDGKLIPLWHVASNIPRQQSYSNMVHAKMPEFKRYLELNAEESALLTYLYREKKGAEEYIKPEAEEVAEMYADRLAFISISTDPEEAWKRTVEKRNMKGIQWNELKGDAPGLAEKYGTSGIPHYVLINPEGIIVKEWAGYGKGSLKKALSPYFNK